MNKQMIWLLDLLRPYRFRILLGAFLVALTVLANIGLLGASSVLLARAALLTPLMLLAPVITGVRFFGIIRAVFRYGERLYNHGVAFRILSGLRLSLYQHLEPMVPDKLRHYSEGKLYARLIGDVETLQFFYLRVVSVPLGTLLVVLATIGILWPLSPKGTLALIICQCLAAGLVLGLFVLGTYRDKKARQVARDALLSAFADVVHGMQVLKVSQRGGFLVDRVVERAATELRFHAALERKEVLAQRLILLFAHAAFFSSLWFATQDVMSGELKGIYLSMVAVIALASFETIEQLPQAISEWQASLVAAKDMSEIMNSNIDEEKGASTIQPLEQLSLRNLSFTYGAEQSMLFEDLNMNIAQGQHIAMVGRSGSGKSTIGKIILKLWRPDAGDIYWNEIPYASLKGDALRNRIAMLEQQPSFFNASVRENLCLAYPEASDDLLWSVLEDVSLANRIRQFPEGLSAHLGENGCRLSGGERQRLALARILLRDAEVVILDEPMQNLDGINAELLQQMLRERLKDKTVILITHSLQSLPGVDFIFLFDYGKLIARGNHQDLLEHHSIYQSFWQLEQGRIQEA